MTTTKTAPKNSKARGLPGVIAKHELPRAAGSWSDAITKLKDRVAAHVAVERRPLDWDDETVFDPNGHLMDRDYIAMDRLRGTLIPEIVTELAKDQPYTVRRFLECYLIDSLGNSNVWCDKWATE